MDTNLMKRLKARAESSSFLNNPLMNPRFSRSKLINDKIRMETIKKPEKIESFLTSPELKSQVFEHFLQELELRLGYKIPHDSIDHAAKFIKDKLTYKIQCSIAELHEFWKKIEKILLDFETFNCNTWNLGLAGEEFVFLINSNDSGRVKDELSRFMELSQEEINQMNQEKQELNEGKLELNKSDLDFCNDLERNMRNQYENLKEIKLNEDIWKLNKKSTFLIKSEIEESKKRRIECSQLKTDLEWQKEELRFIIAQTKYKKNECVTKEVLLENQISRIRTRRVSMAQELENIEIEHEKLEQQKEKIQNIITHLTSTIDSIRQKPAPSPADPSSIQSEIQEYETQLRSLEKKQACCSFQEQDSLSTQIYRLKTKISSLKSISVINSTLTSTTSAKNLMQNLNKIYKISKPCKSPSLLKTSPFSLNLSGSSLKKDSVFNNSSNLSTLKTDRSLSVGISNLYEKNDEDTSRLEVLKKRESRLAEKEEMIEIAQDKILNKIGNFDEVSCIKSLKAENRRIKGRLEKKERNVDEELQEVLKVKRNTVEREKEVEKVFDEVEEEKWRIVGVVEDALEYLKGCVEDLN